MRALPGRTLLTASLWPLFLFCHLKCILVVFLYMKTYQMNFRYFSKGDFFLALATFSSGVLLSVELRWGGGGHLCLWNRQSTSMRPQTVLGSAREPAEFCLGEVIAVPHALPFSSCRELGNGDVTPRPPSPRAAVLHVIVLLSCPEEGGLASQAHC